MHRRALAAPVEGLLVALLCQVGPEVRRIVYPCVRPLLRRRQRREVVGAAVVRRACAAPTPAQRSARSAATQYHVFGLIGTALSKKISSFQSSSLKVAPISPNAW